MRVIIVGAGEVGTSIAANLAESHDVVVIERDDAIVDELTYSMDVLPIQGDGTDLETMQEAGVEDADMVIAATDLDEANVVVCGTVKAVSDAFTIARVKRRGLLDTWKHSEGAFAVDFMVSSDLLTAEAVFRISGLPSAHDVDTFAGGLVRMAEFEIGPDSPVTGLTVQEADRYDSMTFVAIFRDDELIVVDGETTIEAGDRAVVIGSPDSIQSFADDVTSGTDNGTDEVVIIGGSGIGYQAALVFEDHNYRPRLIERDHDRARYLSEKLSKTTVMESDATDTEFLVREHVDEADVVVVTLESDEQNLLVSLLARQLGVRRTVAIVETAEYADLFETVGVDVAVNPREETAEEIVRFTREGHTEKVAMLEHDQAEVIEVEVDQESVLVGKSIADSVTDLPAGFVVGAISRSGELITPRGDTMIRPGDHVVVFVESTAIDEIVNRI